MNQNQNKYRNKPLVLHDLERVSIVTEIVSVIEPRKLDVIIQFDRTKAQETIQILQDWVDSPVSKYGRTTVGFFGSLIT